jgi:hypothetical protein
LAFELSCFFAARWRNQARIVPGFTSWQHFWRSSGLSSLPASASRRRCRPVKERLFPPVRA